MDLFPSILQSLKLTSPLLVLIAAGLAVLAADVLLPRAQRWALGLVAMIGIGLAAVALHLVHRQPDGQALSAFSGALTIDGLTFLAHNVILGAGLFLVLISPRWLAARPIPHGEYYALLVFAVMAMMALAASSELLSLFLNVEVLSITLYILAGIEKRNTRSSEAAFKYFLLGSFAAAFLLLGIAFVFGATGTLRYDALAVAVRAGGVLNPGFLTIGICLILAGFGFKLTLAPFHMYAPDVYEGAPTPIAAALATGAKVAGLTAFFHFMEVVAGWPALPGGVWTALYALAVLSMIVGNAGAVVQPNLKRMLAYSSIAHSAYAIVPVVVMLRRPDLLGAARDAVAYYLMAYTAMTLLVFGVAASLGPQGEGRIAQYAGLGRRAPLLAALMTLGLVSLLGMPPTVGFLGKLNLFRVAIDGGHTGLAVIGVLASVASAFYYLRVTVTMYMTEPEPGAERVPELDGVNYVALGLSALCIVLFVIAPGLYLFAH